MLPVTVVKTRFEALPKGTYRSTPSALRAIFASEGLPGLYSGIGVTLLRDVPFSGLYFMMYEALHSARVELSGDEARTPAATFAVSILAGIGATGATHPFDVVKTRLQTGKYLLTTGQPTGMMGIALANHVRKTEGVSGMFRGLSLRLVKRPLTSAVVWTVYELCNTIR